MGRLHSWWDPWASDFWRRSGHFTFSHQQSPQESSPRVFTNLLAASPQLRYQNKMFSHTKSRQLCRLHVLIFRKDTTSMLLLTGWNLHADTPQVWLSFTTRKHCPDAGSQTLAVQSKDADSMKSLVIDQSKSDKKENINLGRCSMCLWRHSWRKNIWQSKKWGQEL